MCSVDVPELLKSIHRVPPLNGHYWRTVPHFNRTFCSHTDIWFGARLCPCNTHKMLMEIWRAIFCKTLNWCFECTHGSNEHAEHTWKRYKPFIITPTWRCESLGWRHHTHKKKAPLKVQHGMIVAEWGLPG